MNRQNPSASSGPLPLERDGKFPEVWFVFGFLCFLDNLVLVRDNTGIT